MGVREDLIAVRALIDAPKKWRKGAFGYGTGCLCAAGAIWSLGSDMHSMNEASDFLRKHLPTGMSLVDFNDAPTTTHADIMALFDRAIAKAGASHV